MTDAGSDVRSVRSDCRDGAPPTEGSSTMPTAQEEQVNANLDLLLSQFERELSHDPAAQADLKTKIEKVRTDYQTATADAKDAKYSKEVGDAIAKSLPSLVKGAMAASDAFKKGDYI